MGINIDWEIYSNEPCIFSWLFIIILNDTDLKKSKLKCKKKEEIGKKGQNNNVVLKERKKKVGTRIRRRLSAN